MTRCCTILIFSLSFIGVINSFSFVFNFGSLFHSSFNFTKDGMSTSYSTDFHFGENSDSDGLSELEQLVKTAFSEYKALFSDIPASLTAGVESSLKAFDESIADMFVLLNDTVLDTDKQFLAEACCLKLNLRDAIKKGSKLIAELTDTDDLFLRVPMENFTSVLKELLSHIVKLQVKLSAG